jgi:thiopeptide-type bacteriocin biosynthesis protein
MRLTAEPRRQDDARAGGAGAQRSWVSAHLFCHGSLDNLLVTCVGPLAGELTGGGLASGWFYLRYWDGGTHVRVRVLAADDAGSGEIESRIRNRCEAFFRSRPSPDVLRADDYERLARTLAAGEGVSRYAESLHPNNSVAFIPYQPEHHRYGSGTSLEAVERQFMDSSNLALRLVARGLAPEQRNAACLSAMVLAWLSAEPDLPSLSAWSGLLYDGWAGRFELGTLGVEPATFDDRFARQRGKLVDQARRLSRLAAQPPVTEPGSVLEAWANSTLALSRALGTERGRRLYLLDDCAHLFCNRMGVSVVEECYLRYLGTRAIAALSEEQA